MDGVLTGLAIIVAVVGQWMTLFVMHRTFSTQAEREQHDRIRRAYGDLLRAGKFLDGAFRDLMFYPKGHPYPGTINAAMSPPVYDPFEFVNRSVDQAQSLVREATVTIVLDRDDDAVLQTWAEKVEQPFMEFSREIAANGLPQDTMTRQATFASGLSELAKVARDHFAGRQNRYGISR